jgi:hypothetical protein
MISGHLELRVAAVASADLDARTESLHERVHAEPGVAYVRSAETDAGGV